MSETFRHVAALKKVQSVYLLAAAWVLSNTDLKLFESFANINGKKNSQKSKLD